MYPVHRTFLDSVELEITQNIRRLQRHPSILVWAGNNENEAALVQNWYGTRKEQARFIQEYIQLYQDVVAKSVRENDEWHVWLYSSPSNGNKSQHVINANPQDNYHGDGKLNKIKCFALISNCYKQYFHHLFSSLLQLHFGRMELEYISKSTFYIRIWISKHSIGPQSQKIHVSG